MGDFKEASTRNQTDMKEAAKRAYFNLGLPWSKHYLVINYYSNYFS